MNDEQITKIVKFIVYFSAFITLALFAFNLYMYRITHSILWLFFTFFWCIDGVTEIAQDDEELYDSISKLM